MNIRMVIFTTVMFALLIALADQACSSILRPIFERPRPSRDPGIADLVHIVNGKRGGMYGFPSCHAANTFALACFIMLLFKNRALTTFFMLWAIVTCYTRIYVGVHYPGDLLFGTIVGFAAGAVTYGIYRFCLRVDGIANGLKYHQDRKLVKNPTHMRQTSVIIFTGLLTIAAFAVYSIWWRPM
jgi:hypothetical protein